MAGESFFDQVKASGFSLLPGAPSASNQAPGAQPGFWDGADNLAKSIFGVLAQEYSADKATKRQIQMAKAGLTSPYGDMFSGGYDAQGYGQPRSNMMPLLALAAVGVIAYLVLKK